MEEETFELKYVIGTEVICHIDFYEPLENKQFVIAGYNYAEDENEWWVLIYNAKRGQEFSEEDVIDFPLVDDNKQSITIDRNIYSENNFIWIQYNYISFYDNKKVSNILIQKLWQEQIKN